MQISQSTDGVLLPVRVTPGASRTGCKGVHDGRLKIGVVAIAEKGKANVAVSKWLATLFKLPRKQIQLVSGSTSQNKTYELIGIKISQAETVLDEVIDTVSR